MKGVFGNTAIRAVGLAKSYRVYRHPGDLFLELLTGKKRHEEVWPLKSVDLDIKKGKVVGILGRNGAGKSTLLKIIAGTLRRTRGDLEINGKVTAILELGTGFHPEYSGRENILLGGMCLGMSKSEVLSKMDSIIEFSELGDFIDQPFRTYSSGMQARLTFATAVSVDPEILIIDEALSVGDVRFQQKSFARIKEFRDAGKTILLVSHDINTITSFCDEALLLENGSLIRQGDPKEVAEYYYQMMFNDERQVVSIGVKAPGRGRAGLHYGDGACVVEHAGFFRKNGERIEILKAGEEVFFRMRVRFEKDMESVSGGIVIRTPKGMDVFGITNTSAGKPIEGCRKGQRLEMNIRLVVRLAPGDYFVTYGVAHPDGKAADFYDNDMQIKVVGRTDIFDSSLVDMDAELSIVS